jgi:hypothetical protein
MNTLITILYILSKQHKCVCINITSFTDMLQNEIFDDKLLNFQPITDRNILRTGLYAMISDPPIKLYVSKIVGEGNFRTADIDEPNNKNDDDWSAEISFVEFAKANEHLMVLA